MAQVELIQVIQLMQETNTRLNNSIKELHKQGKKLASSERDYKIALAHKILELKSQGMPATLINDLAKGNEEIAALRFERDLARSLYDTAKEGMRSLRTQADVLRSIARYQDEV